MNRMSRQFLIFSAAALATAATAGVIGDDGRRAPGAEDADLRSALGLVVCSGIVDNRRRRSAGTGTVVGSRSTVLTAAHVFTDDDGRSGPRVEFDPAADCVFRQFDAQGEMTVEVAISHFEMGEFRQNAGVPNQDWAVLRTAESLPEITTPLPFADSGNDIESLAGLSIKMLAFHADIRAARRTPLLSEGALFRIDYGGFTRLAHTADSGRMSSGAAIVHRTEDGQNIVVGVNRSSANFGDFNLAVPLSIELEEALNSYAFGQVPIGRQRLATSEALDEVNSPADL